MSIVNEKEMMAAAKLEMEREYEMKRREMELLQELTSARPRPAFAQPWSSPAASAGYFDYMKGPAGPPSTYKLLDPRGHTLTTSRICTGSYGRESRATIKLTPYLNDGRSVSRQVPLSDGTLMVTVSLPKSIQTFDDVARDERQLLINAGWTAIFDNGNVVDRVRAEELVEHAKEIVEPVMHRWLTRLLNEDDVPSLDDLGDLLIEEFTAQDRRASSARAKLNLTQHLLRGQQPMQPKAPPQPTRLEGQGDW